MQDIDLINEINKTGSKEAFESLISRHEALFYLMVERMSYGMRSIDQRNLQEQKHLLFWQCIKSYDPSKKTRFSTMVGNYTRYMCLNYRRKNKHQYTDAEHSFLYLSEEKNEELFDKEKILVILKSLKEHEDPRVSKIFNYRYDRKHSKINSWKRVSKLLKAQDNINLTGQGCINIHNKTIKELKSQKNIYD